MRGNARIKTFVLPKVMWLLKLPLNQNSIVIYFKSNSNLKDTSLLKWQKKDKSLHYNTTQLW